MDMTSKQTSKFSCLAMIVGMFVTTLTHAATISSEYNITLSNNATGHISGEPLLVTNHITDGTTYATVLIEGDDTVDGAINFTVTMSSFWDNICGNNCGIDSFGFNLNTGASSLAATNITGGNLPSGWDKSVNTIAGINQDGFGAFDAVVTQLGAGGQPTRLNPTLTFSIDLAGDSIGDYFAGSQAGDNGSFNFAVHIAGFDDMNLSDPVGTCLNVTIDANNPDCNALTSVWVANGVRTTVVPVPAAAWLFGSGLLGLAGIARRKKA